MESIARIAIDSYKGDLKKIVEQLESCDYECEGSILKNNVAFIALKEMAYEVNDEKRI